MIMPCGFQVTNSLKDLGHYRKCEHEACQSRAESWDKLKTEASQPIRQILAKGKRSGT